MSLTFVAMILFNNLCLKNVGVSFYYIGRSLTIIFTVVLSFLVNGQKTSALVFGCCLIIVSGFIGGKSVGKDILASKQAKFKHDGRNKGRDSPNFFPPLKAVLPLAGRIAIHQKL